MCRILSQLTRLLRLHPKSLETHGASLKRVCEQQNIKCPSLAKAVISLYLEASGLLCLSRRWNADFTTQKEGCSSDWLPVDNTHRHPRVFGHP